MELKGKKILVVNTASKCGFTPQYETLEKLYSGYKDKIVIGRGPENDVVLMNDPQVSRLHAQIVLIDREFELVKISQKNAVLVDGQSVDKWKLLNGSVFTIGDTDFRIEYDLGQAIVSVPSKKLADVVNLRPLSHEATRIDVKVQAPAIKKTRLRRRQKPPD